MFCLCMCKYFVSMGTNFLPLWVQTYYIQLWAQNVCLCGCKSFASVGTNILLLYVQIFCLCRCKTSASVSAKLLPLCAQVGANFLPLWAQQWCHQHIQILHIKHWNCSKFIINTTYDFGHKMFASLGAKFLPAEKKIKLVKKSYCFTCATEKNQQASLKKSDCSTCAAEKCSAGASETRSAGTPEKKMKLVKKLYCFTFATERNQQAPLKNWTAPLVPLKNSLLVPLKHALLVLLKKNQTVEIAKMASKFPDFGLRHCTWFCTSASYMFGIQMVPQLDWKLSHNAHSMQECQGMCLWVAPICVHQELW